MFCTKCGSYVADGMAFCTNCGSPMSNPQAGKNANPGQNTVREVGYQQYPRQSNSGQSSANPQAPNRQPVSNGQKAKKDGLPSWAYIALAALCVAVFLAIFFINRNKNDNTDVIYYPSDAPTSQVVDPPVDSFPEEEEDYLVPDADSRYITDRDLENLSWEEICLARNEIFARHGRIFKTKQIREYFESKDWYDGTVEGDYFDSHTEKFFNSYEKANVDYIAEYEREHFGHSYY